MAATVKNESLPTIQGHTDRKNLSYLFAILATLCWSCTGLLIDAITSRYPITPVELSCWRSLIIAVGLGLFLLKGNAAQRARNFGFSLDEFPIYILYGVIGLGVFNLAWSGSVAINKASVATALLFCSPVFVVIGARWLFKEKLVWFSVIAILLDLIGVFLVSGAYNLSVLTSNLTGLGYAITSGFTFAVFTLSGKSIARKGRRGAFTSLFYAFCFAFVTLLIWGVIQEGTKLFQVPLDGFGWLLMVILALGPTLGGNAFFTLAIRGLDAGVVSLFNTLEPPIVAVLAWVILGRVLNATQWSGAALIVVGVLLLQGGDRLFRKANG